MQSINGFRLKFLGDGYIDALLSQTVISRRITFGRRMPMKNFGCGMVKG